MGNLSIHVALAVIATCAAPPPSDDPPYYVRRDTWHESLIASREALIEFETSHAAVEDKTDRARFGPWYTLGPVTPSDNGRAFGSELPQLDLERAWALDGSNAKVSWRLRLDLRDGWVWPLYPDQHVVYSYREIEAPAATVMPVYVDACGELTAWLDGQQVLAPTRGRITRDIWGPDVHAKPEAIPLSLSPGQHGLLVRIILNPQPRPRDDADPWRRSTLDARRPWGTVFTGYSVTTGPAVEYEKLAYGEISQIYFSTSADLGPQSEKGTAEREQLWQRVRRDFPDAALRRQMDTERDTGIWRLDWKRGDVRELALRYAGAIEDATSRTEAVRLAMRIGKHADLEPLRELYERGLSLDAGTKLARDDSRRRVLRHDLESLRLAVTDLIATHGSKYPHGVEFLARLADIETRTDPAAARQDANLFARVHDELQQLRLDALLANPLLDFDRLLLVKRRSTQFNPSLPYNWANNSSLSKTGHDNSMGVLSPVSPTGTLSTLYGPDDGRFVGDVDLDFDAEKLLFSMPGRNACWHVFEVRTDGTGLRQVTRDQEEVDSFDGCYLPDGRIMFCSTASFAGVPCVRGRDYVGVLYRMDADGDNVRQLTFEQDQDWCPTVLGDGRVLYTRWEYTDIPHFFSRLLFHMNPDGTGQRAVYGTNSYWPNGIFYARPIPDHPTKVVGVVSGHHAARRSGELVMFDPAQGNREADGVVQRIPGRGQKVEPVVNDRLVAGTWPRFLHPFPLSDKYFLVSVQWNEQTPWAIYLVDVFDNMLLVHEDENYDLLEPIPLRATARPPVIPDKADWTRNDAVMHLTDVYSGQGLEGVPRGQVKKLRVIAYHYAFQNMADDSRAIGVNSSWDVVKRVLGTVPVHEDGSALFRVPANTPITIQPLDARGRALQLMRSWMTAMPGETQSCVGCHAGPQATPTSHDTLAERRGISELAAWYGPARGFSFDREVQPVLDRYCVGCHDGKPQSDGRSVPDFTRRQPTDERRFSPAYLELQRYVRRPGPETDIHLLPPAEFHANTSELVQILEKGHYNVELDTEAWDRLVTWVDLNAPCHGTWQEAQGCERMGKQSEQRRELRRAYASSEEDPEAIPPEKDEPVTPILPTPLPQVELPPVHAVGWPFDSAEARRRQDAAGPQTTRTVDLGNGVKLELVLVPAGEFVMGDATGGRDELPTRVQIAKPFWMGRCEITNEQFAQFDPRHDSRYMQTFGITSTPGYPLNEPAQPVVRVSWRQAMAFCEWLSARTGQRFTLPTEALWEYGCRAGTTTPMFFGSAESDFSRWANLADRNMEHFRDYSHNAQQFWLPSDPRFDDGEMVSAPAGRYQPNAWGLHDMHGNVWEWTQSNYNDNHNESRSAGDNDDSTIRKVVRGGSWFDRPSRSSSAFRLGYPAWQGVFNVGFRVVCENGEK